MSRSPVGQVPQIPPTGSREPKNAPAASRSSGPQLVVGRANDRSERDADRFAAEVIRDLSAGPSTVLRSAHGASGDPLGGTTVVPELQTRIRAARGGGHGLPNNVQRAVEERSGSDLSRVRVHTGAEADDLSRSLQATAFTVGSDVFFSDGAYRPGTVAGAEVLAHELGHVVQSSGPAKVQRLFGGSKIKAGAPVVGQSGQMEQANGLSSADKAEQKAGYASGAANRKRLKADIAPLESALKKLRKRRQVGSADDYAAARMLRDKAQAILDVMPGPDTRNTQKILGVQYPEERKRIRYVLGEAQLIYDEYLVAMTKKKAGNIYMEAGRNAAGEAPAKAGGFNHLSGDARRLGFDEANAPTRDPADQQKRLNIRTVGASLGLSPAEIAAILTFTAEDYAYINPATANSDSWMTNANARYINKPNLEPVEKDALLKSFKEVKIGNARAGQVKEKVASLKEEGSLHAGMAMQGFAKMPVYAGPAYRGEVLSQALFDEKFETVVPDTTYRAKNTTLKWTTITSSSKSRFVATSFWLIAGPKVAPPKVNVLYEIQLTNGRDIELLSNSPIEKEVATLPGAEFSIDSVTWDKSHLLVKCTQRK